MAKKKGKKWKTEEIECNPSKKVTNLLDRMERILRNCFRKSISWDQKVCCIHNKGTQVFCADFSMSCTNKNGNTIRSLGKISKITPPLKSKCSYEWWKEERGFRTGCKLFITQALQIIWFGFVYIQKRHLNNLSSQPIVPENLLFFPKEIMCDWSLKQTAELRPHNNKGFLSVNVLHQA